MSTMANHSAGRTSGPHIAHLMRKMHDLEEERQQVLQELAHWGSPGYQARRGGKDSNEDDFDLVAMWTESSETLQGVIAEREAQLESARNRLVVTVKFSPAGFPHSAQ